MGVVILQHVFIGALSPQSLPTSLKYITVINTITSTLGNPLLCNDSHIIVTLFPANTWHTEFACQTPQYLTLLVVQFPEAITSGDA